MRKGIEKFFKLKELNTSVRTEVIAGLTTFAALKLFTGRGKEVSWLVYLLTAFFILRFVHLEAR